jgi:uncharacterized protein (DUF885 family)
MRFVRGLGVACALVISGLPAVYAEEGAADKALAALFAQERSFYYAETPGTGPRGMVRPVATKMRSVAPADQTRRQEQYGTFLATLEAIDRAALSEEQQINYDMFRYQMNANLLFLKHKSWRLPLQSDSGFHTYPTRMWRSINFKSVDDYEKYIARLTDMPRYLAENTDNLRQGIADGVTMPKAVLAGLLQTFDAIVVAQAEDSSFYVPFQNMAAAVSESDAAELAAKAKNVIEEQVLPAYTALAKFMHEEYYPAATEVLGASERPDGAKFYADMVRYYTTVDISPEDVHQLGLSEVARIRSEMADIIQEVKFEGSFADFLLFLRTDPQFYAKTEKELMMYASYVGKQIDGRLPRLFGHLPRQPYGIEPVPAAIAPNYTTGRYVGAPADAPRGGYYWVNTYALDKRPMYVIPALTLHEAMPGHHLQIALSNELEGVPEFRLGIYPHAFGEGWGLYSEKLGIELDVYETPYENFGRLTYEMWRALRLVVDTGLHSKGWTRDQAIKLMEENSALSTHNIRTEVDRYIAWPGQALAYKMGELKLLELRKRATEALGDKFDIRAFHDRVLSAGGIPLYMLEARVDSWIVEQKEGELK